MAGSVSGYPTRRLSAIGRALLAMAVTASLVLAAGGPAGAAPKVDHVVLSNGDRLTCEIKSLKRGRLSIGTNALDTVSVYWNQVERMASTRTFEVETSTGDRYYGALEDVAPRRIRVAPAGTAGTELSMDDVVRIVPIEATFWHRIDGNVDLGFSFAKADLETRWTLNSESAYRGRQYLVRAQLASQMTRRQDAERLSRNNLTLSGLRLLGRRWFTLALGQVQTNQELSLNARTVVGGGGGRIVVQSNTSDVRVFTGLVYTRENFSGVPTQNSPELALGADWDWFSAKDDKLDLATSAVSFYNVSGDARARVEVQSAFRVEFLKDFYFSINGYDSYDSTPPDGRARNDLGISLSLGWKF